MITGHRTPLQTLCAWASASPGDPAIVGPTGPVTVTSLWEHVRLAAGRLRTLGVSEGERVIIAGPNSAEWIVAAYAVMSLRAIACPTDPGLAAPEWQDRLQMLGPRLILGGASTLRLLEHHAPADCRLLALEKEGKAVGIAALDAVPAAHVDVPSPEPNDIAAILMTSGSSGRPKGVCLAHRHLIAGAVSQTSNPEDSDPGARWLLNLPLYHVGGLMMLFRALVRRRPVIVQERFTPEETLSACRQDRATHLSFVTTTLRRFLNACRETAAPEGVRVALVGGGPCPAALLEEAKTAGLPVCPTYGMTEAASQIATWRPGDPPGHFGVSARPLPGVEVCIVNEMGAPMPAGVEGEFLVRGPMVAEQYWEASGKLVSARKDGWLWTGDLGMLDVEGFLRITGRKDTIIITGGRKVHPEEVERALLDLPGVLNAAVMGEEDPDWGHAVVAVVQALPGRTTESIRSELRGRLSAHKIPKRVVMIEDWPEGALGKTRRPLLTDYIGGK